LKFKNILNVLSYYKERQKKIDQVMILSPRFERDKDTITCFCTTGRYNIVIKLSKDINIESDCWVDCECQSFAYEFANAIRPVNGLLNPTKYPDLRAKEKNKYQHVTGCKHIIKFAQYIFHRKSLISKEVKLD